jgi:hypothetical protein
MHAQAVNCHCHLNCWPQEVQALAAVEGHPNVINYYDSWTEPAENNQGECGWKRYAQAWEDEGSAADLYVLLWPVDAPSHSLCKLESIFLKPMNDSLDHAMKYCPEINGLRAD